MSIVASLFALAALPVQAAHDTPGTASISGTVKDPSGAPVANECVRTVATDSTHYTSSSTTTQADGTYELLGVSAQEYKVAFGCWGGPFVLSWHGGETHGEATAINLQPGEARQGVDGVLYPAARLTGRVVDTAGAPQANRGFHAFGEVDGNWITTGSDGSFTLTGKPASYNLIETQGGRGSYGPYHLAGGRPVEGVEIVVPGRGALVGRAVEAGGAPVGPVCVAAVGPQGEFFGFKQADATGAYRFDDVGEGLATVRLSGCGQGSRYAGQFLGGAWDIPDAHYVDVVASQETVVPDHEMALGGTITGRMTGPEGAAPANGCVMVSSGDANDAIFGYTDAAGDYAVHGLRPGSYNVFFQECGLTDLLFQSYQGTPGDRTDAGTPVLVEAGATVLGIDAQLVRGAVIEGVVIHEVSGPVVACVVAYTNGDAWPTGHSFASSDGRYHVGGLPAGEHTLQFSSCFQGTFGMEWWQDAATPETATRIPAGLGEVVTGIDPIVSDGATVRGTATMGGKPASGACIKFMRPDVWPDTHLASTDAEGRYSLSSLGTGTYSVSAYDCEGLYRYAETTVAEGLSVTAGETQHVHLALAPATPKTTFVAPASGPAGGGNVVSIVGRSLRDVAEVRFGDRLAPSFTQLGSFQVDAVAPIGEPGSTVDVTVTTAGGSRRRCCWAGTRTTGGRRSPASTPQRGRSPAATRSASWAAT